MSYKPKPAETQEREIEVRHLWNSNRDSIHVTSVQKAINEVKKELSKPTICSKIILDGDIIYNSNRNGDIEDWESEWNHQKNVLSLDEKEYDCPYDVVGCYKDDLCMQCQFDEAGS